jgi:hypothetical protein
MSLLFFIIRILFLNIRVVFLCHTAKPEHKQKYLLRLGVGMESFSLDRTVCAWVWVYMSFYQMLNFNCLPNPSRIIHIKVNNLISDALFSILDISFVHIIYPRY